MKVRCNYCMEVFEEKEIVWNEEEETEYCPKCGKEGCLMDLEEDSENKIEGDE